MTSEMAETTTTKDPTIRHAWNMYVMHVQSLKSDDKSKAKSQPKSDDDKPSAQTALKHFVDFFDPDNSVSLRELTQREIVAYADRINGTGTTPQAAERLQAVKDFLACAHAPKPKGLTKEGLTKENLARYVRIRKPRNRKGVAIISNGAQPIELTSEGHAQLQAERDKLAAEIEVLARDIHKARADGDVTENSPLDAAREEHAHKEARVQVIKATLEKAVIIDQSRTGESDVVKIGVRVVVEDIVSKKQTDYTLVNSTEAKPLERRISADSPMGKALIPPPKKVDGEEIPQPPAKVGDEVEVEPPGGVKSYKIKIISIS